MKKLMVLAAVAAMALGAKAEFTGFTLSLNSAQAVYFLGSHDGRETSGDVDWIDWAMKRWNSTGSALFEEEYKDELGGSWAAAYPLFESYVFEEDKFEKTGEGVFSISQVDPDTLHWTLLAINDADHLEPGAEYAVYYATSSSGGGPITIQGDALETGNLLTDSPAPAPEPTSGLLLLLGVAGLALKRKRA